ncbi:MAG: class I tRNA ligase family protein [Lentimicrobiaceae bacterium]|nr:class I tRNA ligase family protein [Lentimicrobiaceae bacterium]
MDYNFREIEQKWQQFWSENKTYKTEIDYGKPKFYVLDMFPYPSGAGLHVGHPLGYIASDIYARYKRLQGYNVLHPMGYDAYGLPAEQYAIQTGTHPAITTDKNIARYREQLDKIGFSYDWDREVRTSDPAYYKWTQWTFIQLFHSWYNNITERAEPIANLISVFTSSGNTSIDAASSDIETFSAAEWNAMDDKAKQDVLMHYRLAYLADTMVNWCPELGTVLANDEVSEGFSIRGGHPVERKTMKQWLLRITAYADRLLTGLEKIDWPESLKEIQRNWIGRSQGCMVKFRVNSINETIEVFTTRADTLFGATFMVLAPEHPLVMQITTAAQQEAVSAYLQWAKNRSERERMTEVKKISGEFTGAYARNPLNGEDIPIWVADYVLMGYGSGAIMAVPAHDNRDFAFARHFKLPIRQVVCRDDETPGDPSLWDESYDSKEGIMINSGFLTGMEVKQAIPAAIRKVEEMGLGMGKVNYRLRDAIFSRQRYWGEPFPVYYKDGIPHTLSENELPLELPEVDAYLPTDTGEPPLARAKNWVNKDGYPLEVNTMPGFAGSSGYYLRYMDPGNDKEYFSQEANAYWKSVDLYIGGAEHATGHLIYARFWNKFLHDLGMTVEDEPFRKLINQGMIQGRSNFVYRANLEKMAEYMLWENLKDGKTGVSFERDYRDGNRKFDFYSREAGLIIEVKRQQSLEKVAHPYEAYCKERGLKMLLIPIRDFLDLDKVMERIQGVVKGDKIPEFTEQPNMELIPLFVSKNYPGREHYTDAIHVDVGLVHNDILDIEAFKAWQPHLAKAEFVLEDGKYICGWEVEKMSKSKYNVQNPDDLIEKYGADTLRLYEMFLGPLEQAKPWDTNGIEGVFRFIRKLWRLFHDYDNNFMVVDEPPVPEELKVLHKTIKKAQDDIERFSFNTAVSSFMICVNELSELKCNKRAILRELTILLSPYAPHIAEELWSLLGNRESISNAEFPVFNEAYILENTFEYPVSFNGKMRFKLSLPLDMSVPEIEKTVLSAPEAAKWLDGKPARKVIVVPGKIVNVVV